MPLSRYRLAALALALGLAGCGPRGGSDPLTIGQLAPRAGPARPLGEHARRGARLAMQLAPADRRAVRGRGVVVRLAAGAADARGLERGVAEAGVASRCLFGGEDAGPGALAGAGGEIVLATVYDAGGLGAAGKEFADRYAKEFNEPPDLAAALA